MRRGVLLACLGLMACGGKKAKDIAVEVHAVKWLEGEGCDTGDLYIEVTTRLGNDIEINGRGTDEPVVETPTPMKVPARDLPEDANEIEVVAVDSGKRGKPVKVPLPPRPSVGFHLGKQSARPPLVKLICDGAGETEAEVSFDDRSTLRATIPGCALKSGTITGGTIETTSPRELTLEFPMPALAETPGDQKDFWTRQVTFAGASKSGGNLTCTIELTGPLARGAFVPGRAPPWASLAKPKAAVFERTLASESEKTINFDVLDPPSAPLGSVGYLVDVIDTGKTLPGRPCQYDRGGSYDTKRRVFRVVAWEAKTGRKLGEQAEMPGGEAYCPYVLTTRDGVPDTDFTGDAAYQMIARWARSLR